MARVRPDEVSRVGARRCWDPCIGRDGDRLYFIDGVENGWYDCRVLERHRPLIFVEAWKVEQLPSIILLSCQACC